MSFDQFFPDGSHIRSRLYEVLRRKTLPLRYLEAQTEEFNPVGRLVFLRAALAHSVHRDELAESWLCKAETPSCDPIIEVLEEIARARGFIAAGRFPEGAKPAYDDEGVATDDESDDGEERVSGRRYAEWRALYTPELLDDAEAYVRAVFARDVRRIAGDLFDLAEYAEHLFGPTKLPADYVTGLIEAVGGGDAAMLRVLAVAGKGDLLGKLPTAELAQLLTTAEQPPPACFNTAQRVHYALGEDMDEMYSGDFERGHALVEALKGADYRCADIGVIMRHACDERPVEYDDDNDDELVGYDSDSPVAAAIAAIAAHYERMTKRAADSDDERETKRARPLE